MHTLRNSFLAIAFVVIAAPILAFSQSNSSISGKVTYGDKQTPLHQVLVQITQLKISTSTDNDGKFEFKNLLPGRYTLIANLEGFANSAKSIQIVSGANGTVDFELSITSRREEVTVTASGKVESVSDSIQSVSSVGSTRIIEKAATSIGEVLDGEPGVSKRSFGVGSSRPVIRGFDGDRVLVMQDGIRAGSIGSQSADHGEPIDPLSLERLEVVKGPATLLYGSSAIGGVVNAISNDENESHDGLRGSFSSLGSTANRQGAVNGGLEYGLKNWLFRGNGTFQREGDYNTPIGRIPNSASRATSGSGAIGYFGEKGFFNATYNNDRRRYGIPFAALFEAEGEEDRPSGILPETPDEDIDIRMRNQNFRVTAGFRDIDAFISSGTFVLNHNRYNHREIEIADGIETIATTFRNDVTTFKGMFEQKRNEFWSGRFGFEGYSRNYESIGAEALIEGGRVKHNSNAVFGLQELSYKRVSFQIGGRYERNTYKPVSPSLLERSFGGVSGALGVKVGLWDGGSFVANYTNSFRAPALEELYNNGPHIGNVTFEIGNENLRRERTSGFDVSLRHSAGRLRISGDLYRYDIKNFVFLSPVDADGDGEIDFEDGLPVAEFSQANSQFTGAELSGEVSINKYFAAFFGADTVRAKLKNTNVNLPRIPPTRARIGLDFRYKGLSLRPEVIAVNEQTRIFPLETRTAGYGIVNVAGSFVVGKEHFAHIFTVNAYNLGNKLYRNHLSFIKDLAPEIGRGIRVGYTIRFF